MTTDHPCYGCEAHAMDHCIRCPLYGVISSGRCKRIQRKTASEALQGMTRNTRTQIKLRSKYFSSTDFSSIYNGKSYQDRAIRLTKRRKPQRELGERVGQTATLSFGFEVDAMTENGNTWPGRSVEPPLPSTRAGGENSGHLQA